ncbi:MAG: ribonuclease HIII [Erysipelotrichales bacterium]|nr:ribonuclease HIII [Erysipelotrichales bacterium]
MASNNVTLKIDEETKNRIIEFYEDFSLDISEDYVIFKAKYEKVSIKIYQNNKGEYKATFSGENAINEALIFDENAEINETEVKEKAEWLDLLDQIGSDEVGVGDLFGPTVVVAVYTSSKDIEYLKELGIKDSKKLSDTRIRELAPLLMKKLTYSSLTMPNNKLNEEIEKGNKKLVLEAKMHNQAHLNVLNKINKYVPIYIDQFLISSTYIKYLNDVTIAPNIYFKTKGESYYPSIAAASIIARYIFLIRMDELNEKYQTIFPLGAGKQVDDFLAEFLKNHEFSEVKDLVKAHFKNFKNIFDLKLDL